MDEKRKLGKNFFWNSFGTLFYLGCQWLMSVLVVRFSGNYSDAGILSLAMSISSPLTVLAMLNLRTFQVADTEPQLRDTDFIQTRILTSGLSLLLCAAFALLQHYDFYTFICILFFMVFRISEALVDVFHGIDQKAWRLDIAGKSFVLRGIVTIFGLIIGEYVFKSLLAMILCMAFGAFAVIAGYDIPRSKRFMTSCGLFDYANIKKIIKIGLSLGCFAFFLNSISSIPRVFLERWHGEDVLGVFASIANITLLIPQATSFLFNPLVPIFSEKKKQRDKKGFCLILWMCIIFTGIIGFIAIAAGHFLGEWALVLLIGESIRPYCYLFVPILFSAGLLAFTWLLCTVLTVLEEYNSIAVMTILTTVLCIVMSIFLIKDGGLWGTIEALIIALAAECLFLSIRTVWAIRNRFVLGLS